MTDERERLIQFKTNIDVVMSVLDKNGLGDWLADRLVAIGDGVKDDQKVAFTARADPFLDERLRVANLPAEPVKSTAHNRLSGAEKEVSHRAVPASRARRPGARRAISEIIKWMNYVTDNRFITLAADLSESINVEHGSLWGHYDPVTNPLGHPRQGGDPGSGQCLLRHRPGQPERQPGSRKILPACGRCSGTYGAFTPLMYTPARVWSQQNQDSRFRMGVLHILVGHSGPETAADGRTHFGIFATAGLEAVPARPDHPPEFLGL